MLDLLFRRDGLCEHAGRQRRNGVGVHSGFGNGARRDGLRSRGNHFSANAVDHLRRSHTHALVDIENDGRFAGMVAALASGRTQNAHRGIDQHARLRERLLGK